MGVALPRCDTEPRVEENVAFFVEDRTPHARAWLWMRVLPSVYSVRDEEAFRRGLRAALSQSFGARLTMDRAKSRNVPMADGSVVLRATFDAEAPTRPDAFAHFATMSVVGRLGLYTLTWAASAPGADAADDAIVAAIDTIVHDDGGPGWATAEQAVASQSSAIRACYVAGLGEDPTLTGRLEVSASVRANGTMARLTAEGDSGLPLDVESCVLAQLRPLRLAPRGEPFRFTVPIQLKLDPKTP